MIHINTTHAPPYPLTHRVPIQKYKVRSQSQSVNTDMRCDDEFGLLTILLIVVAMVINQHDSFEIARQSARNVSSV